MQNHKAKHGSLSVNFLTEVFWQVKIKKKVSFVFLLIFCHSSIEQETTHFISVTHHDGLMLQPWLLLRTSISQAESSNVPCLEGLLIRLRWTAQEERIHSLQHFFSGHFIMWGICGHKEICISELLLLLCPLLLVCVDTHTLPRAHGAAFTIQTFLTMQQSQPLLSFCNIWMFNLMLERSGKKTVCTKVQAQFCFVPASWFILWFLLKAKSYWPKGTAAVLIIWQPRGKKLFMTLVRAFWVELRYDLSLDPGFVSMAEMQGLWFFQPFIVTLYCQSFLLTF